MGVGCGVKAEIQDDCVVGVKGDQSHPSNFGRLCVKGSALSEVLGSDGRLLSPVVDGHPSDWDNCTRKGSRKNFLALFWSMVPILLPSTFQVSYSQKITMLLIN